MASGSSARNVLGADQAQVVRCLLAAWTAACTQNGRAVYFERFESPWNQRTADERKRSAASGRTAVPLLLLAAAAMSPPGSYKEDRKTGKNSKAQGPKKRIKELYVKRIGLNTSNRRTPKKTIQVRAFLTTAPLAAPNNITGSVCLHAGRTWRSRPLDAMMNQAKHLRPTPSAACCYVNLKAALRCG